MGVLQSYRMRLRRKRAKIRAFRKHFSLRPVSDRTRQICPGDVLLFRMRAGAVAKHLGIQAGVGDGASFIHAYTGHGVVESPLTAPWARRIVARFAFPERGA